MKVSFRPLVSAARIETGLRELHEAADDLAHALYAVFGALLPYRRLPRIRGPYGSDA